MENGYDFCAPFSLSLYISLSLSLAYIYINLLSFLSWRKILQRRQQTGNYHGLIHCTHGLIYLVHCRDIAPFFLTTSLHTFLRLRNLALATF